MREQVRKLADAYLDHYRWSRAERDAGRKADLDHASWDAFDSAERVVVTTDIADVWELIIELVDRSTTLEELNYVAAGPVEDMLNRLDDAQVDAVLKRARDDARWRYAIAGTYTSRMTPRLASAIEGIQREGPASHGAGLTGLR